MWQCVAFAKTQIRYRSLEPIESVAPVCVMRCAIWYHLCNLKNVKNTHGGVLKVALLHGCFSRVLNCTNGAKSRKTSHIKSLQRFLLCYFTISQKTLCKPLRCLHKTNWKFAKWCENYGIKRFWYVRKIFCKANISYPWYTHVGVHIWGYEIIVF